MALTFRENGKLLERSRTEAETDALTGLANRRKLMSDLQERLDARAPTLLILFDLDGFKAYNDAFGHPAGDALLRRMALKLAAATTPFGCAYRMGGDEFCVLGTADSAAQARVVEIATKPLEEEGEGFRITSACGAILLPEETSELSEALRVADARLYSNKEYRRASVRQSKDVLLLNERDAELRGQLTSVAQLARAVGRRLELSPHELHDLGLAAELHDVGELAIPEEILMKPDAPSEDDWHFIHRHTLVGERIPSRLRRSLGSPVSFARRTNGSTERGIRTGSAATTSSRSPGSSSPAMPSSPWWRIGPTAARWSRRTQSPSFGVARARNSPPSSKR